VIVLTENLFNEFPVLETKELYLRKTNFSDSQDLFEIVSDAEVANFDWYEPVENVQKAKEIFLAEYEKAFDSREEITWGITEKKSAKLIGIACIGDFDEYNSRCVIGYYLNKSFWNRGYMTQTVMEIVNFIFNKTSLNRIEAFITTGNDSSVRMLEKAGFTKEGITRQRDFIKGEFVDSVVMGILKKDITNR